jgi:hypothetical protein
LCIYDVKEGSHLNEMLDIDGNHISTSLCLNKVCSKIHKVAIYSNVHPYFDAARTINHSAKRTIFATAEVAVKDNVFGHISAIFRSV